MKTKPAWLLFVLAIAIAGLVWMTAAQGRRRAEEALVQLEAKPAAVAKVESTPKAHPSPAPPPAAKSAPAPPPAQVSPDLYDLMRDDPNGQSFELRRAKARAELAYREFFRNQALPPPVVTAFLAQRVRRDETDLDLSLATRGESTEKRQAAATLRAQNKAAYENALQQILGPENFHALLEYERVAFFRGSVSELAGNLALMGLPLAREQGDRLLRASLAAAGDGGRPDSKPVPDQIDWSELDRLAQDILTPAQFAYFRSVGAETRWGSQLRAAMGRIEKSEAEVPASGKAKTGG